MQINPGDCMITCSRRYERFDGDSLVLSPVLYLHEPYHLDAIDLPIGCIVFVISTNHQVDYPAELESDQVIFVLCEGYVGWIPLSHLKYVYHSRCP